MSRSAHVHAATLDLADEVDPAAVGAAVTTELCGHWEHEGPCRWPHHNATERIGDAYELRVVFVAPDAEVAQVHARIGSALERMNGCAVSAQDADQLRADEAALGTRLASS